MIRVKIDETRICKVKIDKSCIFTQIVFMNSLQLAFQNALSAHKLTMRQWSDGAGLVYSTVHTFSSGRPPNDKLLSALCNHWPDNNTGLELLRAHLEDEISRASRLTSEISPQISGATPDRALEEDIDLIRAESAGNVDLREMTRFMADLIRNNAVEGTNTKKPKPSYQKESPESQAELTKHVSKQAKKKQAPRRLRKI